MDGKLLPANAVALPINDLGFTRAYAAFEALRTYSRVPFLAEKHIQRLLRTARILHISHPFQKNEIFSALKKTLLANPGGEKLIRIYITAGEGAGLRPIGQPRLIVLVDDFTPPPLEHQTSGVSLMTYPYMRPTPQAKSTNYTEAVLATILAKRKNFDEAVFVNSRSELTEGTTYNLLAHTASGWVVPTDGLLLGITIQIVLRLLKRHRQKVHLRNITLKDLAKCFGLYMTSSTREILPVRQVDRMTLPIETDSQKDFSLHAAFREYTRLYSSRHKKYWCS